MGLDMYLEKRTYIRKWNEETGQAELVGRLEIDGIDPGKATYVIEQIGYWRKANAIHRWFVENVQNGEDDCKAYPVTVEQLQALLTAVETVLEQPDMDERILPTQEGFFFGSMEYDDGYCDDLKQTVEMLRSALTNAAEAEFTYQSSW